MAIRNFVAFDSAGLTVAAGSPSLTPGSSIINNSSTPNGTIFDYAAGFGVNIALNDLSSNTSIFDDDQPGSHTITDGAGIVSDGASVESESQIFLRALDEFGNETGPQITVYVFSQGGNTSDVWGFASDIALVDGTRYVKTGGSNNGSSSYSDFITCFGPRTVLRGPNGPVPVEDLEIGQMIWTLDDPACPVSWIGRATVEAEGRFAPVVIAAGAIGNSEELVVSPEHRIYFEDLALDLLFGHDRALVAAKHLVGLPGVDRRTGGTITYTHLMFDRHRIVDANGCLSESFFPADMALAALDYEPMAELLSLYPDLIRRPAAYGPTAAPVLRRYEAEAYRAVYRHQGAAPLAHAVEQRETV
ncbi:Hint domain-containing protein [Rhodophyticola sp.]|jgi:hypothetical protein|uniref:Hint domain-containing protein n=1 Tax=Rhodophyticola sp. TaxID=2680032 RepID=UPI003D293009